MSQGNPDLGLFSTRELLEEIHWRGRRETEIGGYAILGFDMAVGADNLLDRLPRPMLDFRPLEGWQPSSSKPAGTTVVLRPPSPSYEGA